MKKLFLSIVLAFILTACSGANSEQSTTAKTTTTEEGIVKEIKQEDTEMNNKKTVKGSNVGAKIETKIGTSTLLDVKNDYTISTESGPLKIDILETQFVRFNLNNTGKNILNTQEDSVTAVYIISRIENTSENTISIYPDQGKLVIPNTKEQTSASFFLGAGELGGEYIGQVIKEGEAGFFIKSSPQEADSIKYVIGGYYDKTSGDVGEDITIEIPMK